VSSGNAFWCNTIAQFILENGAEEFTHAISKSGELQTSLRFLVIGRLEKFTSEAQLVAKYAAIIGDEFNESTLMHILPVKMKAMLIGSMDALAEHGFVQQMEESPERVWCFLNSLIKETLYELTPPR
jgi:predicted ATPase